jgi:uncharacterized glyoxalase superfamily protein PhnB
MKLTNLAPMLESRDIPATIEFYTTVLGFAQRGIFKHEDTITWCDLVRDEVSVMFCLPNEHMNYGTILLSGSLYINVEDVDAVWNSLKDKCEVVYPIENFIYEMREFAVKDNNGYVLNFAESLINKDPLLFKTGEDASKTAYSITILNAVSAVVLFAVNSTAVMPSFPAYLPSFPAGDHSIGFSPSYIPVCAPFLQRKVPGFGPCEFSASYALPDAVPLYSLSHLRPRSIQTKGQCHNCSY